MPKGKKRKQETSTTTRSEQATNVESPSKPEFLAPAPPKKPKIVQLIDQVVLQPQDTRQIIWTSLPAKGPKKTGNKKIYESFSLGGVNYRKHDHILYKSGEGRPPHIGKLLMIYFDLETNIAMGTIARYYRLEENVNHKNDAPTSEEASEIYNSTEVEQKSLHFIISKCTIVYIPPRNRTKFAERMGKNIPTDFFFYSYWYRPETGTVCAKEHLGFGGNENIVNYKKIIDLENQRNPMAPFREQRPTRSIALQASIEDPDDRSEEPTQTIVRHTRNSVGTGTVTQTETDFPVDYEEETHFRPLVTIDGSSEHSLPNQHPLVIQTQQTQHIQAQQTQPMSLDMFPSVGLFYPSAPIFGFPSAAFNTNSGYEQQYQYMNTENIDPSAHLFGGDEMMMNGEMMNGYGIPNHGDREETKTPDMSILRETPTAFLKLDQQPSDLTINTMPRQNDQEKDQEISSEMNFMEEIKTPGDFSHLIEGESTDLPELSKAQPQVPSMSPVYTQTARLEEMFERATPYEGYSWPGVTPTNENGFPNESDLFFNNDHDPMSDFEKQLDVSLIIFYS